MFLPVTAPEVHDIGPELEKHVVADVARDGGSPGFENHAGIRAGMGIVRGGEGRSGEVAGDVRDVETVAAVVALLDESALGGPDDAAFVAPRGFSVVARVFVYDDGEETVAEETHGGLAEKGGAEAVAEGFAVGTIRGRIGELAVAGREECGKGRGNAGFLMQPEDPFVARVERRDTLAGIDVLRPFALFAGRMLDGAGSPGAGFGGWILAAGFLRGGCAGSCDGRARSGRFGKKGLWAGRRN